MSESGPIYLDYNATAPIKPAVVEAVAEAMMLAGNPSSVHGFGRDVRRRIEDAREQIAALVDCTPAELVFTAGGTEANNTALRGAGRRALIVSAIEHPAILRTAEAVAEEHVVLPVNGDGVVDMAALDTALAAHGSDALVSIMLANNETGVIQPVAEIAARAKAAGALVHCDAVQAPGRIPVSFAGLGVDMMSIAAHKFAGPKGIGALVVRAGLDIAPLVTGGGQERGAQGRDRERGRHRGLRRRRRARPGRPRKGGRDRGAPRPHGSAAARDRAGRRHLQRRGGAAPQHELPHHAGGTERNAGHGPRSRRRGGERGLRVLVRQGRAEPRAARAGRGGCGGRLRDPRQHRLGDNRGRDRALPWRVAGALWGAHQPLEGRRFRRRRLGSEPAVPTMTFIDPDGTRHEVEAPIGDSVLDIAFRHGIDIEGACEGAMACSTCHVIVDPAWYGKLEAMCEDEEDMLDLALGLTRTSRLGCQIVITDALDGLVVTLPDETNNMM